MKISNLKFHILSLCALSALRAGALSAAVLAPGGGDDTAALQAAVATPGAAVQIAGTLKISSTVTPAAGANISGGAGGQVQWTGAANTATTYALKFTGAGLTVTGVTFNGAGLNLDGSTGASVTGCTIENIPGGTSFGVYFGALTNAKINANTFTNIAAIGAIMGYDAQGCSFNANTMSNVGEGMHIIWNNAAGNCSVSNNDISAFGRHGIELQGDPQGLQVVGNYVHDPAAAASHIWLSIATGGDTTRTPPDNATGVVIRGNACTAPAGFVATPAVNYCMLEAMGSGTQVLGNYFAGGGWGGLVTDNPNMTWSNNQCHAVAAGVPYTQEPANPAIGAFNAATQAGNTSDNNWTGALPAAIAATVGPGAASTALSPLSIAAPATQPAITLVNNGNGSLSGIAPAPISAIIIAPSTANPAYPPVTLNLPAGTGSATFAIGNIPANWVVLVTAGASAPAQIQVTGGPAPSADGWAPVLLQPTAPATQPAKTVTHTITVYSDGSISSN